jgi:hypothetical protein
MADLLPLVIISGNITELPPGDTAEDVSVGTLTPGPGIVGGGPLSDPVTVSVALADNASGLIFAGTGDNSTIADDGSALALSLSALASGNLALSVVAAANASGEASVGVSNQAIASGTAAIEIIDSLPQGDFLTAQAGSAIVSGQPVGINNAQILESLRTTIDPNSILTPDTNFYPIATGIPNEPFGFTYLPEGDRLVAAYQDSSQGNRLYARVGRIQGNEIIWGSGQTQIGVSDNITEMHATNITGEDKVVVAYRNSDASSYLTFNVIDVNAADENCVVGSDAVFNSSVSLVIDLTYDSSAEKVAYCYADNTISNFNVGIASVSGLTITKEDERTIQTNYNANTNKIRYSPQASGFLVTTYESTSRIIYGQFFTASGEFFLDQTPLTPLVTQDFLPDLTTYNPHSIVCSERADRFLLCYEKSFASVESLNYRVLEISGSTINVYDETEAEQTNVNYIELGYNPVTDSCITAFNAVSSGLVSAGQIDVNSNKFILLTNPFCFASGWTASGEDVDLNHPEVVYASGTDNVVVAGYFPLAHSRVINDGCAVLFDMNQEFILPLNENQSNNFIGISQQTVSSGDTVTVRLQGSADTTTSGFLIGANYYVDTVNSGWQVESTKPATWSGAWQTIGASVGTNSLFFTDSMYN